MTTASIETEQRVAIWSLSPQTIGAYFAIFLVQYIPGIAFEAHAYMQQIASEESGRIALDILKASGPIGIGSAMNAIAVAVLVEAVMVLAKMVERQRWEQGRARHQRRAQAIERKTARLSERIRHPRGQVAACA